MYILAGIVMLGVLVVVHEFGHFVVAKLFRVGVPVFSVGMGPRVFGFTWGGTDYRLSALPVGGYVRLAGADPFGEEDPDAYIDPDQDFMNKPVWQRLLVMLAGPVFNLVLPLVLFTGVLMFGEPQADTTIGTVLAESPADEAGFRSGDRVVAVAGDEVEIWNEVVDRLHAHAGQPIPITVERRGETEQIVLPPDAVELTAQEKIDMEAVGLWSMRKSTRVGVDDPDSPAADAGLQTGDAIVAVDGAAVGTWDELMEALSGPVHAIEWKRGQPDGEITEHEGTLRLDPLWTPPEDDPVATRWGLTPVVLYVGDVANESAAHLAGVKPSDRLYSVDGTPLASWSQLLQLVRSTADAHHEGATPRELELVLIREGERIALQFAPRMEREIVLGEVRYRPIMGIHQYPEAYVPGPRVKKYYSLFEAVPRAGEETLFIYERTLLMLGNLFTGQTGVRESLGGPVEIFRMAGEGAERGIFTFLRLIGTISISLGIINLLPVPVLDGGQILFYLVEGVRGRPLSLALRERLQMVGVLLLVALMLFVTVNDVGRLISTWTG